MVDFLKYINRIERSKEFFDKLVDSIVMDSPTLKRQNQIGQEQQDHHHHHHPKKKKPNLTE
jgi:hypothetical protein